MSFLRDFFTNVVGKGPGGPKVPTRDEPSADASKPAAPLPQPASDGKSSPTGGLVNPFDEPEQKKSKSGKSPGKGAPTGLIDPFEEEDQKSQSGKSPGKGAPTGLIDPFAEEEKGKGAKGQGKASAALKTIKITPDKVSLAAGEEKQFKAQGISHAGAKRDIPKIAWSTSNEKTISIDKNTGLAKAGYTAGPAKIFAKDEESGVEGSIDVTVTERVLKGIWLSQSQGSKPRLVGGGKVKFQAWGTTSDGANNPIPDGIVWSVSDRKVLSIESDGMAYAVGLGKAKIIATHQPTGIKGEIEITVDPPGAGARKVNVQIMVNNFDDEPIMDGTGLVSFRSPGAEDVGLGGKIKGGVLSFTNLTLVPEGTMELSAWGFGEAIGTPIGNTAYKLPSGDMMTFHATQKANTATTKADSPQEAAKNVGATGKQNLDYKVEKIDKHEWRVMWGDNTWVMKQV